MKLQYLLAIFLFISSAPISVYAEQEQEPELTDFSTTSKLSGVVRFVLGNAYRNNGYANFGQASALTNLADLYGHRAYDGSIASVQSRSINMIDSPLSQGEAFIFIAHLRQRNLAVNWHSAPPGLVIYQITSTPLLAAAPTLLLNRPLAT